MTQKNFDYYTKFLTNCQKF